MSTDNNNRQQVIREAKLAALRSMGKSEKEALEWLDKEEAKVSRPVSPPVSPPPSPKAKDTVTVMMTSKEARSFAFMTTFGVSEAQAWEQIQAKRKAPPTKPHSQQSTARLLTAHNANKPHSATSCPACHSGARNRS